MFAASVMAWLVTGRNRTAENGLVLFSNVYETLEEGVDDRSTEGTTHAEAPWRVASDSLLVSDAALGRLWIDPEMLRVFWKKSPRFQALLLSGEALFSTGGFGYTRHERRYQFAEQLNGLSRRDADTQVVRHGCGFESRFRLLSFSRRLLGCLCKCFETPQ